VAANKGNAAVVDALLAAGANKEAKDKVRGLGVTQGEDRECFAWFVECRDVGPQNASRF